MQAPHEPFDDCVGHGKISFDHDTRLFAGQPV